MWIQCSSYFTTLYDCTISLEHITMATTYQFIEQGRARSELQGSPRGKTGVQLCDMAVEEDEVMACGLAATDDSRCGRERAPPGEPQSHHRRGRRRRPTAESTLLWSASRWRGEGCGGGGERALLEDNAPEPPLPWKMPLHSRICLPLSELASRWRPSRRRGWIRIRKVESRADQRSDLPGRK